MYDKCNSVHVFHGVGTSKHFREATMCLREAAMCCVVRLGLSHV